MILDLGGSGGLEIYLALSHDTNLALNFAETL